MQAKTKNTVISASASHGGHAVVIFCNTNRIHPDRTKLRATLEEIAKIVAKTINAQP